MEPIALFALLVGGVFAGIINSIAGGGSFLTLPLLIFVGLPPTVANATNRVAVAVQSLAGVAGFDDWPARARRLFKSSEVDSPSPTSRIALGIPWSTVRATLLPTLAGSLFGALIAAHISDEVFLPILGALLLFMSGVLILRPSRWFPPLEISSETSNNVLAIGFFFAGVYGGFVQAGVGFIILALLVSGKGLDLVRANGVKVALIHLLTLVALVVFVSKGQVAWTAGAALALGNGAGGYIGARLAIRIGDRWIRWVVFAVAFACALEILGVRTVVLSRII